MTSHPANETPALTDSVESSHVVTPPSSTMGKSELPPIWPIPGRSFGLKRSHIPKPLDVDALLRERQFSGPYSSIPLLSHKRPHSVRGSLNSPEEPKRRRLPQITPAPYMMRQTFQEPPAPLLPPPPPPLPPLMPSMQTEHDVSPSRSHSHTTSQSSHTTSQSRDFYSRVPNWTPESHHSFSGKPILAPSMAPPSQLGSAEKIGPAEKKERFINLCEQIWDIIHD